MGVPISLGEVNRERGASSPLEKLIEARRCGGGERASGVCVKGGGAGLRGGLCMLGDGFDGSKWFRIAVESKGWPIRSSEVRGLRCEASP